MAYYLDSEPPDEMKHMRLGDKMDLTPRKDGGVIKEILEEGEGEFYPNSNDKVTLLYTAYVGDVAAEEYIFDSSERDGKSFTFTVLKGQVVRGFEMAVMTMKQGERAMLTLGPTYAFGKAGAPPRIPAETNVMFETKILSIDAEDLSPEQNRTILKHILKKGKGWAAPNEGCLIKVHIKGCYDDRVFMEGEHSLIYGEGADPQYGIPDFLEDFFMEWKRGELAEIRMSAEHCFGNHGCPALGIPPGQDLVFEVHMKDFERAKDIWEMDEDERMDQCEQFKAKGNMFYKRKEYGLARKFYSKVVDNLEFDMLMIGEQEARRKGLLLAGFVNLAQAYLKEENFSEAKICCDKVLDEQPNNVKALYRRALARYETKDYEDALEDFRHVLNLEPGNKAARNHVILCENKAKHSSGSEREMCQRMFYSSTDASSESDRPSSGMDDIGNWDNTMAHGMMTLEQEAEAWDETLPPKGDNNHGH